MSETNHKCTVAQLVPVAETVRLLEAYVPIFVIPAKAGIQFFALAPCFRRGDIVDFRSPQQILMKNNIVQPALRHVVFTVTVAPVLDITGSIKGLDYNLLFGFTKS